MTGMNQHEREREMLSQMKFISAICRYLEKKGYKEVSPRQFNAVIDGVNGIIREFEKPYQPARPSTGLQEWLKCDDTGMSSRYMAYMLADGPVAEFAVPRDAADFGRCLRFLNAVQLNRKPLDYMDIGRVSAWFRLVENWPELQALYEAKSYDLVFNRIQEIINAR